MVRLGAGQTSPPGARHGAVSFTISSTETPSGRRGRGTAAGRCPRDVTAPSHQSGPTHPGEALAGKPNLPGRARSLREVRLLFVCTGNLCRSPVAERLAAAWARQSLGDGAAAVEISSAGLQAPVGQAMDPRSAAILTQLGGDPTGVQAKAFSADMGNNADLVLTMTRRQRRAVLSACPRGLRRTFTLLEAADLVGRADLHGLESRGLTERTRDLSTRLDAARALRMSTDADDVEDPVGQSVAVHHEVATTIAAALQPLVAVLFVDGRRAGLPASGDGRPVTSERHRPRANRHGCV